MTLGKTRNVGNSNKYCANASGLRANRKAHIFIIMEFKLKKKTEIERVTYLVGKYFTGEITLLYLKIQLNAMPDESDMPYTTTS